MPSIFKNGKFRFPAQLSSGERGEPSGPRCAGSDSGRRREEQEAAPRADGTKKANYILLKGYFVVCELFLNRNSKHRLSRKLNVGLKKLTI